jgi:predicted enzyme related to lactoylglutathione lyase
MGDETMKRVTGIGGIFFKARDPKGLKDWYRDHLGIESGDSGATFKWRDREYPERVGCTVWAPFPGDTRYFDPSESPFMINYRVENLDRLLRQLRNEGVEVDDRIEEYEYGRFGWIMDPEGNRIELWEPPEEDDFDD